MTAPKKILIVDDDLASQQALKLILEETPEKAFARHKEAHLALVKGLSALGFEMLVKEPYRLPMLNAVRVPEDMAEVSVRRHLRDDHRIEIGAGLGPLAGKIWRIGLMGHTARKENVEKFLTAFRSLM